MKKDYSFGFEQDVLPYIRFLYWRGYKTCDAGKNMEDMINSAVVECLEVADKYDASKGAITTFFKPYILHAFTSFFVKNVLKTSSYYLRKKDEEKKEISFENIEDIKVLACSDTPETCFLRQEEQEEKRERLCSVLKCLNAEDTAFIYDYYGLGISKRMPRKNVGEKYNLSLKETINNAKRIMYCLRKNANVI